MVNGRARAELERDSSRGCVRHVCGKALAGRQAGGHAGDSPHK